MSSNSRRDVGARQISLFQKAAQKLVKMGFTPNQVSVLSSVFALLAGFSFVQTSQVPSQGRILFLLIAIFGMQMRLVCNLLDGLMAIEGGLKTASGELFNDVPDRISDSLIFIGAGFLAALYLQSLFHLGWAAALMAVMTAYVRCLGAAMTGKHDFSGFMAKQHRMFILTVASGATIFEVLGFWPLGVSMSLGLFVVVVGATLTVIHRLRKIYLQLESTK
ncbi:CDP-alcohol phosphatidyltransferase family protein [bacterium]|nr:CDP-alcohol phosphatidyltransferase family protein [bacterium]